MVLFTLFAPAPWHWLVLAMVLLALELAGTGGFLLWVGIAAAITAALLWLLPDMSVAAQLAWFAVMAVVSAFAWWQYLRSRKPDPHSLKLNRRAEQFVGQRGVITEAVVAGRGRARIGDTTWIVEASESLQVGDNVEVVDVIDDLIFRVERVASL